MGITSCSMNSCNNDQGTIAGSIYIPMFVAASLVVTPYILWLLLNVVSTHMNQSKVDVYGRTIVPIFCGQSFSTSCMEATVLGHGDDHLCDHSAKSLSPAVRPPSEMKSENRLRVVDKRFFHRELSVSL